MTEDERLEFFKEFNNVAIPNGYLPWYNNKADYNTNAKSYYDYLARIHSLTPVMVDFINRLLNRNIKFNDTDSIDFTKIGDWIDNGKCEPNHYDDIINIKADVIISLYEYSQVLNRITGSPFKVDNGSEIRNDGLWSPNYLNILKGINTDIGKIKDDIADIYRQIKRIDGEIVLIKEEQAIFKGALQKILNNLNGSGAISNNNIEKFNFNRDIASGNINLFGGSTSSFIRTNKNFTENDILAGY